MLQHPEAQQSSAINVVEEEDIIVDKDYLDDHDSERASSIAEYEQSVGRSILAFSQSEHLIQDDTVFLGISRQSQVLQSPGNKASSFHVAQNQRK